MLKATNGGCKSLSQGHSLSYSFSVPSFRCPESWQQIRARILKWPATPPTFCRPIAGRSARMRLALEKNIFWRWAAPHWKCSCHKLLPREFSYTFILLYFPLEVRTAGMLVSWPMHYKIFNNNNLRLDHGAYAGCQNEFSICLASPWNVF